MSEIRLQSEDWNKYVDSMPAKLQMLSSEKGSATRDSFVYMYFLPQPVYLSSTPLEASFSKELRRTEVDVVVIGTDDFCRQPRPRQRGWMVTLHKLNANLV